MFIYSFFIIVVNKSDFKKSKLKNIKISCTENIGIDELKEQIFPYNIE